MGDGEAQPDDTVWDNGEPSGPCLQEWEGTAAHPILAGADLNVVEQETTVFLYDADNPGAWIRGKALEIGVGHDDEPVGGVNGRE